eukprot:TRINITY_DN39844_c0_g1_i2.p1 TRINITY_DN39844_c0_g1~~TRINITY_DN39844_c0_g1_i2.p1  ORF type:complete len:453 (-),score=31.98 TRINITY_DN39844_c0_g1_i2:180-1460(-)
MASSGAWRPQTAWPGQGHPAFPNAVEWPRAGNTMMAGNTPAIKKRKVLFPEMTSVQLQHGPPPPAGHMQNAVGHAAPATPGRPAAGTAAYSYQGAAAATTPMGVRGGKTPPRLTGQPGPQIRTPSYPGNMQTPRPRNLGCRLTGSGNQIQARPLTTITAHGQSASAHYVGAMRSSAGQADINVQPPDSYAPLPEPARQLPLTAAPQTMRPDTQHNGQASLDLGSIFNLQLPTPQGLPRLAAHSSCAPPQHAARVLALLPKGEPHAPRSAKTWTACWPALKEALQLSELPSADLGYSWGGLECGSEGIPVLLAAERENAGGAKAARRMRMTATRFETSLEEPLELRRLCSWSFERRMPQKCPTLLAALKLVEQSKVRTDAPVAVAEPQRSEVEGGTTAAQQDPYMGLDQALQAALGPIPEWANIGAS